MQDSFNFGKPGRQRPQVSVDPRFILGLGVLLAVAVLIFFGMKFFSRSGHEIAKTQVSVVNQVGAAQDVEAKSSLEAALRAAKVAFLDGGENYTSAGPAQLSLLEPSLTYTDGPSTAPSVVSVQNSATSWSAAVMSASGTCWWISDSGGLNATLYGSGTPCTGAVAASATASKW